MPTKTIKGSLHKFNYSTQTWDPIKHPRGEHGHFAHTAGAAKPPPKSFKFYKQGYKPKAKDKLTGHNVHGYGKVLHDEKQAGKFANDYEFWLRAQNLASQAKKLHPNNAPTPHHIVNAAFHHEIAHTGSLTMLDSGVKPPEKNLHGKTPTGVKLKSKFLAPGQMSWTGKTLGGVSGARVYEDNKGVQWIVKVPGGWSGTSKAYSNSAFLSDLDVATSRIQNKAGLPVPAMHTMKIGDKTASVQKMYNRVEPVDFGELTDKDVQELQQNMVVDWLLSNHDAHSANFLKTDKGIVGIDKGQAFKYFSKDKLTAKFGSDLNPPLAPNKPVYSTMMEKYKKGELEMTPWNEGELKTTIDRIQNISDDEYRKLLTPYAAKAKVAGVLSMPSINAFLDAAVARKNSLSSDFYKLWDELQQDKHPDEPKATAQSNWEGEFPGLAKKYTPQQAYEKGIITTEEYDAVKGDAQDPNIPAGYKIVPHPNDNNKYVIQKPTGDFAKAKDGSTVKSWDTQMEAAKSSTMAKYKAQAEQMKVAQLPAEQQDAKNSPTISLVQQLLEGGKYSGVPKDAFKKYHELKAKIEEGNHTPAEYLEFKQVKGKIMGAQKAAGAAQVEHEFDGSGFSAPTPAAGKKTKGGFKEQPKFKKFGGTPPALESAKGPNALTDGQKLWDMKKAGNIEDDFKMWSEAKKLSTAGKKAAGPNAQVGVDYSSPNQIRNVAMRLEFDETGDVVWETAQEKTSETYKESASEVKKANALHDHKPSIKASLKQHLAAHAKQLFGDAYDPGAPAGSYTNPHAFQTGDTQALQAYGYKYTDHKGWPPEQKQAWYGFSGSYSGTMNTYFRTGEVGMFGNSAETKKKCIALVDAFKSPNIKPLDDWTQVVRGTSGGWEFGLPSDTTTYEDIKAMEGKVVRNKCPVSSSLRDRPPWGSYRITYKLPPGFRGLGLYGHSAHSSENEMVLPPGMAYRIVEVKKGSGSYQAEILAEVVDVKLPEIT